MWRTIAWGSCYSIFSFVDRCLSFCTFSFGHCVVHSSSIYRFWLPLWYLQTLLKSYCPPHNQQHNELVNMIISKLFDCFIDRCCYYTQVSYTGSWEPLVSLSCLFMGISFWQTRYDICCSFLFLFPKPCEIDQLLGESNQIILRWSQKKLGRGSPFNVSYQNCCKKTYMSMILKI
jgi:hypothetical protein